MKYRTVISVLVASAFALTSMPSLAQQGQGQGGGGSADRTQQADRDRDYDRDRIRLDEPDQDRIQDRDRLDEPDQDRDQDRTRIHDPANVKIQDLDGSVLVTGAESNQYPEQLGMSNEQGSGKEFQAQQEKQMQQRAMNQGTDAVPPEQGPIYGGELMSVEERNEYREQLRLHDSEGDGEKFQAQHREQMQERARAQDVEIEAAE